MEKKKGRRETDSASPFFPVSSPSHSLFLVAVFVCAAFSTLEVEEEEEQNQPLLLVAVPPPPPGGEKTLGCAAARGGGGLSEGGSPQRTRLKPRVTRTKKKITLKMGGRGETFPFLFSTRAPLPSRLLLPRFLPPPFFSVGDGGKILPLLSQLAGEEFLSWFSYHFPGRREELASTIGPALIRPHSSPMPWPISACRRRLNRWDMTTQYSEDVKWRECESLARACLLEFPAFWPRKMQRFSSFL